MCIYIYLSPSPGVKASASIVPAAQDEQHGQQWWPQALGQEHLHEQQGHGGELQAGGGGPGGLERRGEREVLRQQQQSL